MVDRIKRPSEPLEVGSRRPRLEDEKRGKKKKLPKEKGDSEQFGDQTGRLVDLYKSLGFAKDRLKEGEASAQYDIDAILAQIDEINFGNNDE